MWSLWSEEYPTASLVSLLRWIRSLAGVDLLSALLRVFMLGRLGVAVAAVVAMLARMTLERVVGRFNDGGRVLYHVGEFRERLCAKGFDLRSVAFPDGPGLVVRLARGRRSGCLKALVELSEVLVKVLDLGAETRHLRFQAGNPLAHIRVRRHSVSGLSTCRADQRKGEGAGH